MGENISGPVPVTADSLFGEASTRLAGGERVPTDRPKGGGALAKGAEPLETTTTRGRKGGRGEGGRRQLAVFPYEYPSPIATTFDVTFDLPDVGLVADADRWDPAAGVGDGGGGGSGEISGAVEVGEARSTLLTWRMLR